MVVFDLDGTIIDCADFIWNALHDHFETDGKARHEASRKFFDGEISYKEWFEHDIKMMKKKNANKETLFDAMKKIKLIDGAKETLEELKKRGHKLAIISGSVDTVINYFSLGDFFDEIFINKIFFDEKGEIARLEHTPYDVQAKADGLNYLTKKFGITPEECIFVGDHFNDIEIAKLAGLSIAFNPKSKELEKVSDVVVKKKDLREILKFIQ